MPIITNLFPDIFLVSSKKYNGGYWTNPNDANLDGLRINHPGRKGCFTLKTP